MLRNVSNILFSSFRHASTRTSVSTEQFTKVHFENGVQYITMSHAKSRNSLSLQMIEELTSHILARESDVSLRAIVLRADGPVFSAGHNLKELSPEAGKELHHAVFRASSKLMLSIVDSPVPVIAAVNGLAAAAGCQLVAGCDLAICTARSSFSTPGARFGIFCSTPGIAVVRAVPPKVAADMLFTAESITASQALQHGLVSRVVADERLEDEVTKITSAICDKSRAVVEMGKKFLHIQIQKDLATAYRLGEDVMVNNLALPDGQEGIHSFMEKRKPKWKHG